MANISTLTVKLRAETAKFQNDLKRSKSAAQSWGSAVRRSMNVGAAAVGAMTVALGALTKRSLEVVDQQQKMADRLGLTQKALVGLTLAGEQTGNSQRNLQLALQRSTRRISEAAQGTGTAVTALEELGVSAKALSRLTPDEAFIALAGAFEKVEGQSDKVRLAFKLFDSEGVGLVNTLKLGEEGIRDFIKRTEELGVALERDQTQAIEDANDAIGVMKLAFSGLGNQIAARLSPALVSAAEAITNIVERVTQAIPKFSAWLSKITGVRRELENLTKIDLEAEIKSLTDEIGDYVDLRDTLLIPFDDRSLVPEGIKVQVDYYNDQITKLLERINAAKEQLAKFNEDDGPASPLVAPGVEGADETGSATSGGFRAGSSIIEGIGDEIQRQRDQWIEWRDRAVEAIEATLTPSERLQEAAFQINRELQNNPFFTPELAARLMQQSVDAYLAELERMKQGTDAAAEQMSAFADEAFRNMQGILAEFLFDPFEDGLKGMLKSFGDMLRKMVAELIAQQILTSFFNFLSPGLGTAISAGTSAATTTGNAIGIGRTDNRARVVGERGPELFTPGATGAIRPLGALNFESNLNIGSNEGGLSLATLIPILEENNRKVKGEIVDAFDRGAYA